MFFSRKNLMDSMNMISNNMVLFHDYCFTLIFTILISVCFLSFFIIKPSRKISLRSLNNASMVETTWTILPMWFLISLSGPCFYMLYVLESEKKYDLTMKTVGHQWYWSYEGEDLMSISFDSYMKPLEDLKNSSNRLLEVDNSLFLPFNSTVRMCITSSDVLHSWALPNMSLKADATPGRLNMINLRSNVPSSIYSQCSEICGINHSFMPIQVNFMSWEDCVKCMSFLL